MCTPIKLIPDLLTDPNQTLMKEVQPLLGLFHKGVNVNGPLQVLCDGCAQKPEGLHCCHSAVHDGERREYRGPSPKAHNNLQSFEHVQLQIVAIAPDSQRLNLLMKVFGEVFTMLSEEQRNAIIGWVKERVAQNEFKCVLKAPVFSVLPSGSLEKPIIQNGSSVKAKMNVMNVPRAERAQHSSNDAVPKCPPRMLWLKANVLAMMGPYLSRLSLEEAKTIPKEELCEFFRTPDFSPSFQNVSGMQPALGRTLFQRLKQECSSSDNFTHYMDRLGSLACFFDGAPSLNLNLSRKLLSQIDTCNNPEIDTHQFRRDVNASELVNGLPDSLLSSLSLSTLEKADLRSVDQLQGRGWTRAQSAFLLKKILGNSINLGELRKLGQAVQGVTCEMIEKINQTDVLEMAQILNESCAWLSRIQIQCTAQKIFASLEEQRPGYFTNINNSELQAIPAMLLIHLPVEQIQNLSDAVCPAFMEKMKQVNLSFLANSSPARYTLTKRAIGCLKRNVSDLSAAEVLTLGPLVCELDPAWISSLNPAALNSTLKALVSCQYIQQQHREHLFRLLTTTYGDPAYWSEEDMRVLGPLLLLNDTVIEKLPAKSWMKSYLSDLMDSLPSQPLVPLPKEFGSWFDLSALQRKLFELRTSSTLLNRRKRELVSTLTEPTLTYIEDLKQWNVYWTPTQLSKMTVQTFKDAVPTLGEIPNYSTEQLAALRAKTLEAWQSVSMLNESQMSNLGCICQSFSADVLAKLRIASLDTLETLTACNFTQTQRTAVWQAFERVAGISVAGLGHLEMVGLGQFICGLQPGQIDQLNSPSFREAVEVLGRAPCPLNSRELLKEKAVAAFGKPKTWTEAQVSILGNIIAGLSAVELGSLNPTVLPFIQPSAIPLIPSERLAALSVSQLKALGPDNAAAVTEAQRAGLRVDQRAALDEAMGLKTAGTEVPTGSSTGVSNPGSGGSVPLPLKGGAAVESMAGWVLLMQAIAPLLFGYIL
ncbi:otoancorin-like [Carassius carassius]|uniref:otoancorin-like n=1 Tax=Carassius carassius TaxID=217509 RepID=UPI0028694D23|nr:otoancorin-like [Carassius carassius]